MRRNTTSSGLSPTRPAAGEGVTPAGTPVAEHYRGGGPNPPLAGNSAARGGGPWIPCGDGLRGLPGRRRRRSRRVPIRARHIDSPSGTPCWDERIPMECGPVANLYECLYEHADARAGVGQPMPNSVQARVSRRVGLRPEAAERRLSLRVRHADGGCTRRGCMTGHAWNTGASRPCYPAIQAGADGLPGAGSPRCTDPRSGYEASEGNPDPGAEALERAGFRLEECGARSTRSILLRELSELRTGDVRGRGARCSGPISAPSRLRGSTTIAGTASTTRTL